MGNDTKYDRLMNWFKNQWFFVILIFLAVFSTAVFSFINTTKKGVDNIKEITNPAKTPEPTATTPDPTLSSQPAAAQKKIIKGQLIDAKNAPIKQARITFTGLGEESIFTNTDNYGRFSKELEGIGSKSLVLSCTHNGFQNHSLDFQVDFSSPEALDLASITLVEIPAPAKAVKEQVKPAKANTPGKSNDKEGVVIDNNGTIGVVSTGDNATFDIKQEFNTHADKDSTDQK